MSASRNTCPARTAAGTAADGSGTAACPAAAACVLDDAWAADRASAAAATSIVPAACTSAVGTSAADVGLPTAGVSACSFSTTPAASAAVVGPFFGVVQRQAHACTYMHTHACTLTCPQTQTHMHILRCTHPCTHARVCRAFDNCVVRFLSPLGLLSSVEYLHAIVCWKLWSCKEGLAQLEPAILSDHHQAAGLSVWLVNKCTPYVRALLRNCAVLDVRARERAREHASVCGGACVQLRV